MAEAYFCRRPCSVCTDVSFARESPFMVRNSNDYLTDQSQLLGERSTTPRKALLWLRYLHSYLMRSLLCLIFLLLPPPTVFADLTCSQVIYGSPNAAECLQALAAISFTDQTPRYFIETQLLASPPAGDWAAFEDPRAPMYQTQSVQLPKYWTYSKIPYSYDGAISSPKTETKV